METMQGLTRSHHCGRIVEELTEQEVVLCGWVERRRDHGGLIFIDLRDRSGVVQIVASPEFDIASFHKAEAVRSEYVLCVRGDVRKRDTDTINPNMPTGTVEIVCKEMRVLNASKLRPSILRITLM